MLRNKYSLLFFTLVLFLYSCNTNSTERNKVFIKESKTSKNERYKKEIKKNDSVKNIVSTLCKDTIYFEELFLNGQKIGSKFNMSDSWKDFDSVSIIQTDLSDLKNYHYGSNEFILNEGKLYIVRIRTKDYYFTKYPDIRVGTNIEDLADYCFAQNNVKKHNEFNIFTFSKEFNILYEHSIVLKISNNKISEILIENYAL